MTHDLAITKQSAARYLLGELTPTERDEFEEHYFDCVECAQDVRAGAMLRSNAKAVLAERTAPETERAGKRESWWQRLFSVRGPVLAPYAVAAALALVTTWQGLVIIPGLKSESEPQLVVTAALRGTVRGSDQTIVVPKDARFFQVTLDVNPDAPFAAYECAIVRGSASPMFTVTAPGGPTAPASLDLLLPATRFEAGEYVVVLRGRPDTAGANPVEIDRFKFLIERR
jgi:hypothetical protein